MLLAFCIWILFSAVAVNLNKNGFNFTTDQLFLLTALPSLSGAILRVPWSFVVPLFGGRKWTVFCTVILIIPCVWLGFAVQNPATVIFLVVGTIFLGTGQPLDGNTTAGECKDPQTMVPKAINTRRRQHHRLISLNKLRHLIAVNFPLIALLIGISGLSRLVI
ncbi:nitrite extrusion protein 2 [Salmonella enterica subsp. arizonae]|nr:nitrite extrusion protein 2 [Salmonella enterica subsp. arizonae]